MMMRILRVNNWFKVTSFLAILIFSPALLRVAHGSELESKIEYLKTQVDNEAVQVYVGKVGQLEAYFFLEWDEANGQVDGRYYYPSRSPGKKYQLKGTNPKPGVLFLKEYTPEPNGADSLSANVRLTKQIAKNRIIWAGTMKNTDGRVLPIEFARPR